MRIEEAETRYRIEYIPGDIESMKTALKDYTRLINTEEAFEDDYCVAHFYIKGEALTESYFADYPYLFNYVTIMSKPYNNLVESDDDNNKRDIQEYTTGETLFFLCAMMHPELKDEVIEACQAMVAFSRKHNDSAEMWITCEEPFGIEPLSIVAHVYPEYGYLLASFIIPYWDDEHMPEPLFSLAAWSDELGINKDTLKAYCYCDNDRAREAMLGYDTWDGGFDDASEIESRFDLLQYLRDDETAYNALVEIFAERYKSMPWIQFDDENSSDNPFKIRVIEQLYVHNPYETWDDDFDIDEYLTQNYIDSPADEAIEKFLLDVEKLIGDFIPVYKPSYDDDDGYDDEYNDYDYDAADRQVDRDERRSRVKTTVKSETDKWRELILHAFDFGDKLWSYVMTGKNADFLDKIVALDLAKIAEEHDLDISEQIEDVTDYSELSEEIDTVFRPFMNERSNTDYREDDENAKNEVLRLYDILHRAMNCPCMPRHMQWLLVDRFEYISLEDLYERYESDWNEEYEKICKRIHRIDTLDDDINKLLTRYYDLVERDRDKTLANLANHIETDKKIDLETKVIYEDDFNTANYLFLTTYILYRDYQTNTCDDLTIAIKRYVDSYLEDFILNSLSKDGKWCELQDALNVMDKEYDNEYQKNYKRETLEKHKKWIPFEEYLREGKFQNLHGNKAFAEAASYLKENLNVEKNQIGEQQEQYELFCLSDNTKLFLNILYWGLHIDSLASYNLVERAFKLCIELAPIYTISNMIVFEEILDDVENINSLINILDEFKKFGLPDDIYWIYQLNWLNKNIDLDDILYVDEKQYTVASKRYIQLMKLYFHETTLFDMQNHPFELMYEKFNSSKEAIIRGSSWISRTDKANLIVNAMKIFGENRQYQKMLDEMVSNKLVREIKKNLFSLPQFIDNLYKKNNTHFKKTSITISELSTKEQIDLLEDLNAKILSDEDYDKFLKEYKLYWFSRRIYVNRVDGKSEVIYNDNLVDLLYTEIVLKKPLSRQLIDLCITEDPERIFVDAICQLKEVDYKKFWLDMIIKFANYQVELDAVRDLLELAINDYGFFDTDTYDIDLNDVIMLVSPTLRNRILHIISIVDYKKLDMVSEEKFDEYMNFMFAAKVDRGQMLKYLIYEENYDKIKEFALRTDYSKVIDKLTINEQVIIMELVAKFPQYHPMIISMKNSKSYKIKEMAKLMITKHHIEATREIKYELVDFGEYTIDTSNGGFNPECLRNSEKLIAKENMYFGIRFTAVDADKAPKVSVHKVIVNHPTKNEVGDTVSATSSWQQNGYNASKIFAGWYFEKEEELIAGKYTFTIIDINGNLMIEKSFDIEI